jgi:protein ECT2
MLAVPVRVKLDCRKVTLTNFLADIHLYLETPPEDESDRWSGRPFRSMTVVHPPALNLDPSRTEANKKRFLDNLWCAQANYRARSGQSVVLAADEQEVESRGGKTTIAKTFFNVYQRTAFLKEPRKVRRRHHPSV